MYRSYADSGGVSAGKAYEEIRLLNAISRVSARLARNLSVLAADRQSVEGGKGNVKNGRNGSDRKRSPHCC